MRKYALYYILGFALIFFALVNLIEGAPKGQINVLGMTFAYWGGIGVSAILLLASQRYSEASPGGRTGILALWLVWLVGIVATGLVAIEILPPYFPPKLAISAILFQGGLVQFILPRLAVTRA